MVYKYIYLGIKELFHINMFFIKILFSCALERIINSPVKFVITVRIPLYIYIYIYMSVIMYESMYMMTLIYIKPKWLPNKQIYTRPNLKIRRLLEAVKSHNLQAVLLFVDFSKAFDSIDRKNMKHILKSYGIPAETVNAIMMLYMNTRSMVRSPDGDKQFFEITTGVLQVDTIAPFLFIICLDYVLKSSIDCSSNFGFTLKKR